MFSDIESSTVLLDRLGDSEFLALLAWHDRIIRDSAAEHRGYVVKSQGDGFMIAFPSSLFALRCALTIQERLQGGYAEMPVCVSGSTQARRSGTPKTFSVAQSS